MKMFNKKMKKLLGKTDICKQFQSTNASLPYMYGLPKTHKVGSPLRPIISKVGSVTYKLAEGHLEGLPIISLLQ